MQNHSSRDDARSQNENGAFVESCNVELEVFEGPLDLLLYLIRKEEIDIYDIPISRIADQYLKYIEVMRMLNLNFAGEFLAMAATLLHIKSSALLPPEEKSFEEDEPVEDPRAELVRQLIEYKQFKSAAEDLQEMENQHHRTFHRIAAGDVDVDAVERPLADVSLFDLLSAFSQALERAAKQKPFHEVIEEEVTVADQMNAILSRLRKSRELFFHSLFPEGGSRILIITTFLALLELIRLKKVIAVQEQLFSEIKIRPRR